MVMFAKKIKREAPLTERVMKLDRGTPPRVPRKDGSGYPDGNIGDGGCYDPIGDRQGYNRRDDPFNSPSDYLLN